MLKALGLEKRGTGGEETEVVGDVHDISNKARLKHTEVVHVIGRCYSNIYKKFYIAREYLAII